MLKGYQQPVALAVINTVFEELTWCNLQVSCFTAVTPHPAGTSVNEKNIKLFIVTMIVHIRMVCLLFSI